ncbi:MAG: hypothetical protein ACJAUV_001500 [Flavobacteriales bacterium]|jgi:hypothetical protein
MMRNWFIILFLGCCLTINAQEDADTLDVIIPAVETIEQIEDSLFYYRKKVFSAQNDYDRMVSNELFLTKLRTALVHPLCFEHPFAKLTTVSTIKPLDDEFRIFNWNVENDDFTQQFFCFVLLNNKEKTVLELLESPLDPKNPEKVVLDEYEWMGALYYDIIEVKNDGKMFYTMLGWDGNNKLTNKKVIDVFSWSSNDNLKLGAPIFKSKSGIKKRIVFEHNGEVTMSLTYHKEKEQIIFNHLAPMDQRLAENVAYYVPDLTFDAYELVKGKWVFKEDVDVRNMKKPKNDFYNFPTDPIKLPNSDK